VPKTSINVVIIKSFKICTNSQKFEIGLTEAFEIYKIVLDDCPFWNKAGADRDGYTAISIRKEEPAC